MKTSGRCGVLRIGACAALVALLATACDWAQLGAGPGAARWAPDAGTTAAEVHSLALQWAQAAPAPPPAGWAPTEPLVRAGRVFTSRGMYIGGHLVT
ncbi:MAG: hypothetical protein JWL83_1981, partial [Actinomycetia bacterium]|nr:hypothetical protein [Actinomycetes bacterium]